MARDDLHVGEDELDRPIVVRLSANQSRLCTLNVTVRSYAVIT